MDKILKLNRIIVFLLSTGLFVLAFEIYLQHYQGLEERNQMWIPIVYGLTGGIIGLFITVIFNKLSYYMFFIVMFLGICVGLLGLYFHNEWRFPLFFKFITGATAFSFDILITNPPLLAPSSFVAICSIGILVALYEPWGISKK